MLLSITGGALAAYSIAKLTPYLIQRYLPHTYFYYQFSQVLENLMPSSEILDETYYKSDSSLIYIFTIKFSPVSKQVLLLDLVPGVSSYFSAEVEIIFKEPGIYFLGVKFGREIEVIADGFKEVLILK